jgi:serine/threonine protein kinase
VDNWSEVERLFHAALEQPRSNRAEFLDQACPEDLQLRNEVQQLLDRAVQEDGFLEGSPLSSIVTPSAGLPPGQMIGRFRIVNLIGAGGMGEVYRARDDRLQRDVAVKVLPPAFALDRDRRCRFEQEARAAGMLNHPNILAVYDIGIEEGRMHVVSELLEGETLRQRLASGPVPLREAVDWAIQTAQGLGAAHRKGVVHRDLKPDNLFLTRDGHVKILDFGLAKIVQSPAAGNAFDTAPGTVMGTAAYMSPEQVRAEAVDQRSDIFSFGAVLYEMVARKRPFDGESAPEIMHGILKAEPPDLTAQDVPPALDRVIRHCLEKEPDRRFQTAQDLPFALESARSLSPVVPGSKTSEPKLAPLTSSTVDAVAPAGPQSDALLWPAESQKIRPLLRWSILAAAGLLLIALAAICAIAIDRRLRESPQPSFQQVTFRKGIIGGARFALGGQNVVYSAAWDGAPLEVYSCQPGKPEARRLDPTGAQLLSVSSDGEMALSLGAKWQAFFFFSGTLARGSLSGGTPKELLENVASAEWSPDGAKLAVVRLVNGTPRLEYPIGKVLYQPPSGWIEGPRFSPDGRQLAFIVHPTGGNTDGAVHLVDLDGHESKISPDYYAVRGLAWSPATGEIWYAASMKKEECALYASTATGRRRLLWRAPSPTTLYDIARDGRVLLATENIRYETLGAAPGETHEHSLSWGDIDNPVDISGDGSAVLLNVEIQGMGAYLRKMDGSPATRLGAGFPIALSPDGKRVVALPTFGQSQEVGVLPTGPGDPVWFQSAVTFMPRGAGWFPDSRRVVLTGRDKQQPVRSYAFDTTTGQATPITPEGTAGTLLSPDGKYLLVAANRKSALYPVDGGPPIPVADFGPGRPVRWTLDHNAIYLSEWSLPGRIYRADLKTGQRKLARELMPSDPAGIVRIDWGTTTPDGRAYAYAFFRMQHQLMIAHGFE